MTVKQPIMACGHFANATSDGHPACAICGNTTVVDAAVAVTQWRCSSCKRVADAPVAFATSTPDADGYGSHYDGCRGWN